mgnify:FL=1|tara:strand:+ start:963 stop:1178 length:216 start_codon:yes stop_codon:yes gene_type:complete
MTFSDVDIGKEVQVKIEGVLVWDEVIKMYLPNGTTIIGPSLTCGHIFARFTMLPSMMQASEATKKHLEDSQ